MAAVFVNVSGTALAVVGYFATRDEESDAAVEWLPPARCVACDRFALSDGVLWIEISSKKWLRYEHLKLRELKVGEITTHYRAVAHDVALFTAPTRTSALCGDMIAQHECGRFNLTKLVNGNELWARVDDESEERWACVSDKSEVSTDLQLASVEVTGYYLNCFGKKHRGELPARASPALDSPKVCGVPSFIAFKATAIALVPKATRRTRFSKKQEAFDLERSAVGLIWAQLRVGEEQLEVWAIESNAHTGATVLEACPPPNVEGAFLYRNVDSSGRFSVVVDKGNVLSRLALGACLRATSTTITQGEFWAAVAPPAEGWCRLFAPPEKDKQETVLKLVEPTTAAHPERPERVKIYQVLEALVSSMPNDEKAKLPKPGKFFASSIRTLDGRGQLWVGLEEEAALMVLESAGGKFDSVALVKCAIETRILTSDEAEQLRSDHCVSPTIRTKPSIEKKQEESSLDFLASLNDFASASELAEKSLIDSRKARGSRAFRDDALRACVISGGGDGSMLLLSEATPKIGTPMIVVRSVIKKRPFFFGGSQRGLLLKVEVICDEPQAKVAILTAALVRPEETTAAFEQARFQAEEMMSVGEDDTGCSWRRRFEPGLKTRTATFELDESKLKSLDDDASLVLKAVAFSEENSILASDVGVAAFDLSAFRAEAPTENFCKCLCGWLFPRKQAATVTAAMSRRRRRVFAKMKRATTKTPTYMPLENDLGYLNEPDDDEEENSKIELPNIRRPLDSFEGGKGTLL